MYNIQFRQLRVAFSPFSETPQSWRTSRRPLKRQTMAQTMADEMADEMANLKNHQASELICLDHPLQWVQERELAAMHSWTLWMV